MADRILPQSSSDVPKITTQDILKSPNWAELVREHFPGADLALWERMKKTFDARQAPKKSKSKKSNTSRSSRRRRLTNSVLLGPSSFEAQSSRVGQAMSELVERVNELDEPESRSILLNIAGQFRVLEVLS